MVRRLSVLWMAAFLVMLAPGFGEAQNGRGGGPKPKNVDGAGTPGTIPVWTGTGETLSDSRIKDNGTEVAVQVPVVVTGEISGSSNSSTAISGHTTAGFGFFGVYGSTASSADGTTGVGGASDATTGITFGVQGFANSPGGVGVQGNNHAGGVAVAGYSLESNGTGIRGLGEAQGVFGHATGTNGVGAAGISESVGVRGQSLICDINGCTPQPGVGGQFLAGAGGISCRVFSRISTESGMRSSRWT